MSIALSSLNLIFIKGIISNWHVVTRCLYLLYWCLEELEFISVLIGLSIEKAVSISNSSYRFITFSLMFSLKEPLLMFNKDFIGYREDVDLKPN